MYERLKARFGERVVSVDLEAKNPWILVEPAAIAEVCAGSSQTRGSPPCAATF